MGKKRKFIPKGEIIERLEEKQAMDMRLKYVRDMLNEASDESVSIDETNKALQEAGFDADEIRTFARNLVAQETKPFSLPHKSPEYYEAIRNEIRAVVDKLKLAGANIHVIKQALEGRISELTDEQHKTRLAEFANRESGDGKEED